MPLLLLLVAIAPAPLHAQAPPPAHASAASPVLTLEEARTAAAADAFAARIADERVAQTDALADQARALWMPTVEAEGAWVYDTRRQELDVAGFYEPLAPWLDAVSSVAPDVPGSAALIEGAGDPLELRPQHVVQGELTVSQALFQPRAAPLLRQARAARAQAEAGAASARVAVDRAVVELYFEAVRLQRLAEVADRAVELARVQERRAQAAVDAEVGTVFALNRARVARQRAERDAHAARTGAAITRDALAELLGRPPNFEVEAPRPIAPPVSLEAALQQAVTQRPELAVAEAASAVAEAGRADARSQAVPVVVASATGRVERPSDLSDDRLSATITVGARWSLWDGGQRRAARASLEHDAAIAALQRDEARVRVEGEVRRAWMNWEQAERDVALARDEAALAGQNVEITEAAFAAGGASALDVDAVREQRRLAEISLAEAEVARDASLHLLRVVTGASE